MKCDCGMTGCELAYYDSDIGDYIQADGYWCPDCRVVIE